MISYCTEDCSYDYHGYRRVTSRWLRKVANGYGKRIGDISIVFCSDDYLLQVNRQYLKHDFYTDVITFDYCDGDTVSGDILISVDTVLANSVTYDSSFPDELHRVIVHGLLHLIGFDDHTQEQTEKMREAEGNALAIFA
ncbi:MAG: rRNA maturation RNase YbeY [Bacteroidales bacterium]|jgi:rRNA maturation RNase YbeY|nr:rRNA maturation RNase YbeY [Bacteroidales bacterium]MCI2122430.1 rRNA maturation RNase YbeY [Bacteroidales bacterium]MCI2145001.1 rRNA maturation RNase YbeY [Bacteroidales bacterium]